MTARHPYLDALTRELAHWPGATYTHQPRRKHPAVVLTFNGVSQFVVYSGSPSDNLAGADNFIRDVRAVLRDLGAARTAKAKAGVKIRTRKRAKPATALKPCGVPLKHDPSRDPWTGLTVLTWPGPIPEAAPARPSLWRRFLNLVTRRAA